MVVKVHDHSTLRTWLEDTEPSEKAVRRLHARVCLRQLPYMASVLADEVKEGLEPVLRAMALISCAGAVNVGEGDANSVWNDAKADIEKVHDRIDKAGRGLSRQAIGQDPDLHRLGHVFQCVKAIGTFLDSMAKPYEIRKFCHMVDFALSGIGYADVGLECELLTRPEGTLENVPLWLADPKRTGIARDNAAWDAFLAGSARNSKNLRKLVNWSVWYGEVRDGSPLDVGAAMELAGLGKAI